MSLVSGKQYSTEITSRKNFIINGNFDIWQRATSKAAAGAGYETVDRFEYQALYTGAVTWSQDTDVPTQAESGVKSNYSMKFDVTTADTSVAAGDYAFFRTTLEGHDYAQIAGNNATLSFWVKSSKTGTYGMSFMNAGQDRSYVTTYTIDVANTWEKKIITVPLTDTSGTWDYTIGEGLEIAWGLMFGSTYQTATTDEWISGAKYTTSSCVNFMDNVANNFWIAQVQFEKGIVATDFEQRHFAAEFSMCQRYYQKSYQYGSAIGTATRAGSVGGRNYSASARTTNSVPVKFPVQMRVTPSFTVYSLNGTSGNISDAGSSYVHSSDLAITGFQSSESQQGFTVVASAAVPAGNFFGFHYTADSEL